MNSPIITTQRLILRQFTLDDAPFIQTLLNDPGWLAFIGNRKVDSLEQARQYIQSALIEHYQNHGFGLFAIQRISDGALLGMSGLLKRETLIEMDLGFALLENHQGQGYAREAALATLDYARKSLQAKRVVAITLETNTRSIQLLEALGFYYHQPIQMGDPPTELLYYICPLNVNPIAQK